MDEPVGQETEHKDAHQGTHKAGTWTNRSARKLSTDARQGTHKAGTWTNRSARKLSTNTRVGERAQRARALDEPVS